VGRLPDRGDRLGTEQLYEELLSSGRGRLYGPKYFGGTAARSALRRLAAESDF
jgi:hypothetical protein